MKKMLLALALVVVSSPLYAQSAPVQIACFKGGYKPMCNDLKQAVNQSPVWHQTKNGLRYIVILGAELDPQTGLVYGAATFGAVLSDPVSSNFPHLIDMVTFNISAGSASTAGPVLVEILTQSAIAFADAFASLQQHGTAGPDFSDLEEAPMRLLTDEDFAARSDQ
jgi:hypothetical protein